MNATIAMKLTTAYSDHAEPLMRYCKRHTKSKEDAEEVLQDTFLNFYNYLENGSSVQSVRPFLFQVATNLLVDFARRSKRDRERYISLDALFEKGFEPHGERGQVTSTGLEVERLLKAVDSWKGRDGDLLLLRYKQGLSVTDIAEKLGITRNAAGVRLHRALHSLRKAFMEQKIQGQRKLSY